MQETEAFRMPVMVLNSIIMLLMTSMLMLITVFLIIIIIINEKKEIERKTTLRIFQVTNKRILTREDQDRVIERISYKRN